MTSFSFRKRELLEKNSKSREILLFNSKIICFEEKNISKYYFIEIKIREFRMFRRVVIPATKGVPSRGFRWMPDKEYRAKVWFYIVSRISKFPREV